MCCYVYLPTLSLSLSHTQIFPPDGSCLNSVIALRPLSSQKHPGNASAFLEELSLDKESDGKLMGESQFLLTAISKTESLSSVFNSCGYFDVSSA